MALLNGVRGHNLLNFAVRNVRERIDGRRKRNRAWILIGVGILVAQRSSPTCQAFAFSGPPPSLVSTRARRFSEFGVRSGRSRLAGLPNPGNDERRRQKKNKYAKFSKRDKLEKDPLEAMIEESEAKVRQLELDKKKKRNQTVPLDEGNRSENRERNEILFPDTREIDPYDPSTYGYTELGTITGAHGVHGLLKITAVTSFPERLCKPGPRHLKASNRRSPRQIHLLEGRHRLDDEYLIKLEGIGDRDAAIKLRGSILYARQEERPKDVAKDEYLVQDLVGLEVFLETECCPGSKGEADLGERFVGTVAGVVLAEDVCAIPELGQDMLEICLPRGADGVPSWRDELVLIPLVPQIVQRVNLDKRTVHISPPEGLLDLRYVREEKTRTKGFLPPGQEEEG